MAILRSRVFADGCSTALAVGVALLVLPVGAVANAGADAAVAETSAVEPVDFNREIRPILNKRCVACHGGVKRRGGINLLFRDLALAEGKSGYHAIVPGKPAESELIYRVTEADEDERMPPEGDPLTKEQVAVLQRWIEEGAPWADHWAYLTPERPALPESGGDWARTGIDRFIHQRLVAEGLKPSPEAAPAVWLRRVSLDLTGLPPTPEEVDAFVADPSPEAFAATVDRLLASPHFGERWASMWLDLARYADSKGYEKDA